MIKKGVIILVNLLFFACSPQTEKINGVSFVASRDVIDSSHVQPVVNINANWAAVMPFAFMQNLESTELIFNIERQWWGEREEGAKKTIELFHQEGIKVMIKPQIWIRRGEFTGHIAMKSEADWHLFEENYRNFILLYARLAQETGAEINQLLLRILLQMQKKQSYQRSIFWPLALVLAKHPVDSKYLTSAFSYVLVEFLL